MSESGSGGSAREPGQLCQASQVRDPRVVREARHARQHEDPGQAEVARGGCPLDATCNNLIELVPRFVDPDSGNLTLQSDSPCIDAANGDMAPLLDIEGSSRYDFLTVANTGTGIIDYADMGAYEFTP